MLSLCSCLSFTVSDTNHSVCNAGVPIFYETEVRTRIQLELDGPVCLSSYIGAWPFPEMPTSGDLKSGDFSFFPRPKKIELGLPMFT